MKVVVFEDSSLVREAMVSWLTRNGHEVIDFASPAHYKACTCGRSPSGRCMGACADAILSDIRMPRANGLDFITDLKDNGCNVPRLALMSGYWTNDSLKRVKEMGIKTFEKPCELSEILQWLEAPLPEALTN